MAINCTIFCCAASEIVCVGKEVIGLIAPERYQGSAVLFCDYGCFLEIENLDYLLKLAFQSANVYQAQLRFIPFQAMLFHL
ncbi:MAG: hypothetical protein LV471_08245 [Nitrosomonas sp.]|nr:hypothetical protein [Nitrosomonas sp.]